MIKLTVKIQMPPQISTGYFASHISNGKVDPK